MDSPLFLHMQHIHQVHHIVNLLRSQSNTTTKPNKKEVPRNMIKKKLPCRLPSKRLFKHDKKKAVIVMNFITLLCPSYNFFPLTLKCTCCSNMSHDFLEVLLNLINYALFNHKWPQQRHILLNDMTLRRYVKMLYIESMYLTKFPNKEAIIMCLIKL